MNRKQVLTVWIIAAVLGVAVAVAKVNQGRGADAATKLERGDRLFDDIPLGKLTTVTIRDLDDEVTLAETDGGWVVRERADFPVDLQMLAGFFDKLNEVRVGQGLEAGPTYDARFGMDDAAEDSDEHGTHVTLAAGGDGGSWTIALGKTTTSTPDFMNPMAPPTGGGRFVRVSADPDSVYVVEETFPRTSANPKDWLRADFLQVSGLESITLRAPNDQGFEPWSLSRGSEEAAFTMEGLGEQEELVSSAVTPLRNLFSFARFEDVLTKEEAAEIRDDAQLRQATLHTFDGLTYQVEVAPKKEADPQAPGSTANYLLSFTVSADLPEERTPADEESEEDKAKADAAFKEEQEELRKKLADQQALEGRVFEVTKWTVDALLKSRADLVQAKQEPAPAPEPPKPPGLEDSFGFPGR